MVAQDDQNTTDFQKALQYCRKELSPESVAILNFEGSRLDHVLSSLYSAHAGVRFVGSSAQIHVMGTGQHVLAVRKSLRLSLMPHPLAVISASMGLLYDPTGISLELGGRDGISNEATGDEIQLTIASGTLLAFVQRFEGESRW